MSGVRGQLLPPPPPQLVLVVAQSRDSAGRLSGINMSALSTGLKRVSRIAKKKKGGTILLSFLCVCVSTCLSPTASVHLPRIGHSTPHFNWYGTERLIRKHIAAVGVPTFMYPPPPVAVSPPLHCLSLSTTIYSYYHPRSSSKNQSAAPLPSSTSSPGECVCEQQLVTFLLFLQLPAVGYYHLESPPYQTCSPECVPSFMIFLRRR